MTQANPAFGRFLGYDRKELTDEELGRFVIEDDRPLLLEAFDDIHAGRSSKVELDQRFVRRDGTKVWGHISVSLMQIRPARPMLWICMVLNIDRQKQADEELHRLMEQLQRSNRELEQFAYVASHDLQEPLRMVASYTRWLARRYQDRLDQDANDFIHFAVDGATRMQKLINDLLAYSRVTRHGKPFEPTNAHAALEEAIANLATAIQATGTIITSGDLPLVMADHSQLVRVFQNLIGNAVKFTDRGPSKIHVSAERRGDECVFAVKDNGIGIEPQYHERIFVLFQHLNPRDQYEGTGLGLSICKRIIERHGGTIWVESNTDVGTTFSFTLKSYRETTPT
ncbi:MAG: ATP-binding protein [Deltaproteobacteria bacterium]